jgi:hypothetical protein
MGALLVLNLASNNLFAEGIELLAEALKGNQIMTELNVSGNFATWDGNKHGEMSGVIALADAIPDMRAISLVNLLMNNIGVVQAKALVSILKEHSTLKSLCGNTGNETELNMSSKMYGAGDAIMLVPEIIDNGAMTRLVLSNNQLACKAGGETIADMLKGNSVLTELDVSMNIGFPGCKPVEFAQALSPGIAGNGALSSLNLASNAILSKESGRALAGALKTNSVLTELDVSDNQDKYGDGSTKGSLDGAGFVKELAVGIKGNGTMTRLDISDNMVCGLYSDGSGTYNGTGVAALSDMVKVNSVLKELNMSKNYIGPEGATVLSLGLSGNGALTKLDISNNSIEQGEALQQIIEYCNTKGIELDNHESESGGDY